MIGLVRECEVLNLSQLPLGSHATKGDLKIKQKQHTHTKKQQLSFLRLHYLCTFPPRLLFCLIMVFMVRLCDPKGPFFKDLEKLFWAALAACFICFLGFSIQIFPI